MTVYPAMSTQVATAAPRAGRAVGESRVPANSIGLPLRRSVQTLTTLVVGWDAGSSRNPRRNHVLGSPYPGDVGGASSSDDQGENLVDERVQPRDVALRRIAVEE